MHVALNEADIQAGRHQTARLIRANSLKSRQKTRCKRTTETAHETRAANVRNQNFTCDLPRQKWWVSVMSGPRRAGCI